MEKISNTPALQYAITPVFYGMNSNFQWIARSLNPIWITNHVPISKQTNISHPLAPDTGHLGYAAPVIC
jgi:hypothetical protein